MLGEAVSSHELRMYHVGSALQPKEGEKYGPGDAMNAMWDQSGEPYSVSDGEWRELQQDWVVGVCRDIARAVGMPEWVLKRFPGNKYRHYGLRRIVGKLYAKRIRKHIESHGLPELSYAQWAREGYAMFLERKRRSGGDVIFSFGIPTPFALLFFAGVPTEHLPAFEQQMAEIITAIATDCPGVGIQWEMPLDYGLPTVMPMRRSKRQQFFGKLLGSVERVVKKTPRGTRYFGHPCHGDLNGRPVVPRWRQKTSAMVDFTNAFTSLSVWWERDGWKLLAFQAPFCDGRHRPKLTRRDVREYDEHLRPFPPGTTYVPGVLHLAAKNKEVAKILGRLINCFRAKGIPVEAVSCPCGNGRMTNEQGVKIYQQRIEVNKELQRHGVI
jgi:hypothetical protein